MYIFKNALKNISRNKGRNILIGIIICVISASCAIGLSIRNSADKIVKSYNDKYELEVSISVNRESLMNNLKENETQEDKINAFNNIENLSIDVLNSYADSKYVKNYYYVYETNMNAKDIEEATDSIFKETTTVEKNTETFEKKDGGPNEFKGYGSTTTTTTTKTEEIKNMKALNGAFNVKGYSTYEAMNEFIDGNYSIVDGEVSSDFSSNYCVISKELASLNDLNVGDVITLVNPNNTDLTYDLVISGIYTENTSDSSSISNMYSASANTIITSSNILEKIYNDDNTLNVNITPTYVLTSTSSLDKFKEEVQNKGLDELYTITDNLDIVNSSTKSIINVKNFATTFLIITFIIGAIVLFVVNMINLRERKYEIGVLRTIGMKKHLVIFQFMIELLIVCVISLTIGTCIGAASSVRVSNNLLKTEIENSSSDFDKINNNFGGSMDHHDKFYGVANINNIDSIDAVVDFKVLVELLGIGLLLTVVSSASSMIVISRFSPLDILKERS